MPEPLRDDPLLGGVLLTIAVFTLFLLAVSLLLAVAATWLRILNYAKMRRWAALEARWEPLMLEVLAGGATEALEAIVGPEDRRFFVGFLLRYARRIRGRELEVVKALAGPYLGDIVGDLERRSPERRARAVHTLATLGLPHHVQPVLRALDDRAPLVVMIAATALLRETRHEHLDAVLEILPRFSGWSRTFLSRALASAGAGGAESLRRILADGRRDTATRAVAADALRELQDLGAADVAARVATQEASGELVAVSLSLLAEIGHPEHLPVASSRLVAKDPLVRSAAARVVANLGAIREAPLLESLLDDPSPWVAIQAARGLKALGRTAPLVELAAADHPRSLLANEVLAEA